MIGVKELLLLAGLGLVTYGIWRLNPDLLWVWGGLVCVGVAIVAQRLDQARRTKGQVNE